MEVIFQSSAYHHFSFTLHRNIYFACRSHRIIMSFLQQSLRVLSRKGTRGGLSITYYCKGSNNISIQTRKSGRFLSSMSAKDPSSHISPTDKERITTLRLYRILQRTCHFFPVQTSRADSHEILLQPELRANDWGRHVIFKPPSPTKVEELFRLFYILNDDTDDGMEMEESSIDDWYYTMLGGNNDIFDQLPPMTTTTCWTSVEQLQDAIRIAFRTEIDTNQERLSDYQYWAIRAIQFLHEQQNLWRNSSVATTEGVRVTATSRYV